MSDPEGERVELLAAGINLVNEASTAQLVRALDAAGVPSVVLKGPIVRRLAYGASAAHASVDVDVLVPWDRMAAIDRALPTVGWRYLGIDAVGEERRHCRVWEQESTGMLLELHPSIAGMNVGAARCWEMLSAHTEETLAADVSIRVLDEPARMLHVALHAAQHGSGVARTVGELRVALERVPLESWIAAARLAEQLDAVAAFVAGMRLVPEGELRLEQIGMSPSLASAAASHPLMADGLDHLSELRGIRRRMRFLGRHLAPPAGYMRVWFPPARRSVFGLLLGYAWRPLWLLIHAPGALVAWIRARR